MAFSTALLAPTLTGATRTAHTYATAPTVAAPSSAATAEAVAAAPQLAILMPRQVAPE